MDRRMNGLLNEWMNNWTNAVAAPSAGSRNIWRRRRLRLSSATRWWWDQRRACRRRADGAGRVPVRWWRPAAAGPCQSSTRPLIRRSRQMSADARPRTCNIHQPTSIGRTGFGHFSPFASSPPPTFASCLIYARALLEYAIFILWVRSFSKVLPSVKFAEDKVLVQSFSSFSVKNANIVQLWV